MKTFRMVAETPDGSICIDVILRGDKSNDFKTDSVDLAVKKWLDFDCGFSGYWVDSGTERKEFTVSEG